jgi:hypothetical protein
VLCCALVQINDRYEFYDTLDLDKENGQYLSPQVWSHHHCGVHSMIELMLVLLAPGRLQLSVHMRLLSAL